MKKQKWMSLTGALCISLLNGCGGGDGNVNPDSSANSGVTTNTSCTTTSSDCLEFVFDYPVAGLNFDCSSDTTNHFITQLSSSAVSGACKLGDKVTFSIKGQSSEQKINLGTVDLNKIALLKISNAPISLVDIATAMVGKAPAQLDSSDQTIQVTMALVKIFQAVSHSQFDNVVTDIQPIDLSEDFKNNLTHVSQSIDVKNFLDGSYASILKPWVDVSSIDDQTAFAVVKKMIYMQNAGVFQSDFLPWALPSNGVSDQYIEGFHGSSLLGNAIIANMYLLTDRTGHTFGYGLQWKGMPDDKTASGTAISEAFKRITLLTKVAPVKMNAAPQSTWLDPISKSLNANNPFVFAMSDQSDAPLKITQGRLINSYLVSGNEALYKTVTGATTGDSTAYGKWNQQFDVEQFNGSIDFSKSNLLTYLDKKVFSTTNNVVTGNYYLFPLYATLIVKFADTTISNVKLGIVIDENGDIRTDIKPNATAYDMSGTCATVNSTTMVDSNGVQQYRIGTTGVANYSTTDKSVSLRMILANNNFGLLDGLILGLNQNIGVNSYSSTTSSSSTATTALAVGGVKINLHNLIQDHNTSRGINITDFNNKDAAWVNIAAAYQNVYNNLKNVTATAEQKALAQRVSGTLAIELPSCYSIHQK